MVEEREIAKTYDKAYSHTGLMGTEVDLQYTKQTKSKLWAMVEEMPDQSKILDLGAGVGDLWEYREKNVDGYATDISHIGALKTNQRFPDIKATQSNADYLPYADDSFKAVICC